MGEAKDEAKNKDKKHAPKQRKQTEPEMRRTTEGHRPQDLNGDGVISRKEWPGDDQSFRELDRDGDGMLSSRDRTPPSRPPVYRDGRFRIR
jgi:hypothetical protein